MDVTSEEVRSSRFQGTRHVYDRREVDAFLHRIAATLEVYERKLAVTESHVESLEQALDLAHNRARSMKEREARISELETALAAAQHNYESVMAQLEERATEKARTKKVDTSSTVVEARARAEELVKEAKASAAKIEADAEKSAAAMRREALHFVAQAKEKVHGEAAAAESEYKARLDEAEKRLAEAEERAGQVELDRRKLEESINRLTARAEAERRELIADAEAMVTEAVAQAQADRDQMLEQARAQLRREMEGGGEAGPKLRRYVGRCPSCVQLSANFRAGWPRRPTCLPRSSSCRASWPTSTSKQPRWSTCATTRMTSTSCE